MVLRIENARIAKGMSREDLAQALGKSKWTVQSWEIHRRHPRSSDLGKIAKVLGVPIASLVEEGE